MLTSFWPGGRARRFWNWVMNSSNFYLRAYSSRTLSVGDGPNGADLLVRWARKGLIMMPESRVQSTSQCKVPRLKAVLWPTAPREPYKTYA